MRTFLDDGIDRTLTRSEEIDRATKATRKIGLGVMGWHDALMQMRTPRLWRAPGAW